MRGRRPVSIITAVRKVSSLEIFMLLSPLVDRGFGGRFEALSFSCSTFAITVLVDARSSRTSSRVRARPKPSRRHGAVGHCSERHQAAAAAVVVAAAWRCGSLGGVVGPDLLPVFLSIWICIAGPEWRLALPLPGFRLRGHDRQRHTYARQDPSMVDSHGILLKAWFYMTDTVDNAGYPRPGL